MPTPTPGAPTLPNYPAGGRIAFQSDRDGNDEIYLMGCDGSGQTNLTNNSASDRDPSWTSGGKLVFSSNRNADGGFDIYLLTLDPWEITRLTTNAADDVSPALSPDGSKVAYVSYRDLDGDAEVYVLTVADRSLIRITDNTVADADPAWSSDGARLAFASDRDGTFDIFEADADGSNVEKITVLSDGVANDRWPDFGYFDYGDGTGDTLMAFASDRDGDWDVYIHDSYDLLLATNSLNGVVDDQPSWSNSGEQVVFHSNRNADSDVWKADFDGSNAANLNRFSPSGNDSAPDWEPVEGAAYCEGIPVEP